MKLLEETSTYKVFGDETGGWIQYKSNIPKHGEKYIMNSKPETTLNHCKVMHCKFRTNIDSICRLKSIDIDDEGKCNMYEVNNETTKTL